MTEDTRRQNGDTMDHNTTEPCGHEWDNVFTTGHTHHCNRPEHPPMTAHECACGSSLLIGRDF